MTEDKNLNTFDSIKKDLLITFDKRQEQYIPSTNNSK